MRIARSAFAISTGCESVRGAFDGNEFFVGALCDVKKVFAIGNEIVALHRNNEQWDRDGLERARDRVVGRAPINLAVVQRVGRADRVRT